METTIAKIITKYLWDELWNFRGSEKHVRVVQDTFEGGMTVMTAVGVTQRFQVEMGLHQESVASPFWLPR